MKEYNEFIKDFDCDGILKDFSITIKDNGNVVGEYFKNEIAIEYLSPGKSIEIYSETFRPGKSIEIYDENENYFEMRFIKKSSFSNDGKKVLVELFSKIELEIIFKNYLKMKYNIGEFECKNKKENNKVVWK